MTFELPTPPLPEDGSIAFNRALQDMTPEGKRARIYDEITGILEAAGITLDNQLTGETILHNARMTPMVIGIMESDGTMRIGNAQQGYRYYDK